MWIWLNLPKQAIASEEQLEIHLVKVRVLYPPQPEALKTKSIIDEHLTIAELEIKLAKAKEELKRKGYNPLTGQKWAILLSMNK